jgi:hypothetical protein
MSSTESFVNQGKVDLGREVLTMTAASGRISIGKRSPSMCPGSEGSGHDRNVRIVNARNEIEKGAKAFGEGLELRVDKKRVLSHTTRLCTV